MAQSLPPHTPVFKPNVMHVVIDALLGEMLQSRLSKNATRNISYGPSTPERTGLSRKYVTVTFDSMPPPQTRPPTHTLSKPDITNVETDALGETLLYAAALPPSCAVPKIPRVA